MDDEQLQVNIGGCDDGRVEIDTDRQGRLSSRIIQCRVCPG